MTKAGLEQKPELKTQLRSAVWRAEMQLLEVLLLAAPRRRVTGS